MPIINTVIQGGGTTPTGTKQITSNGTHDVAAYATADVQVPTAAIVKYGADARAFLGDIDANGILQKPTTPTDLVFTGVKGFASYSSTMGVFFRRFQNLETIKSVSFPDLETITTAYAAANAFRSCTSLTSVDFSLLTRISAENSCQYTFYDCTSLTSVDLSLLTSISGGYSCQYMFGGCTSLTSVDLSSLVLIGYQESLPDYTCQGMFSGCTSLTSVDLSSLVAIFGANNVVHQMFYGCTGLTSVSFPKLMLITPGTTSGRTTLSALFTKCSNLQSLYFNKLLYTTQNLNSCFNNMLVNCTNVTVHFPAEWASTMSSWSNVTNGFGGTNTSVLFDLPNNTKIDLSDVITVNSSVYSRMFMQCSHPNVTEIDLSSLVAIGDTGIMSRMFQSYTNIPSVIKFDSLKSVSSAPYEHLSNFFYGVTGLTTLYFPAIKNYSSNSFSDMLTDVSNVTVHIPSNIVGTISFGGTNTTVLKDLPAVVILTGANSQEYERNPKYDTQTALAWRKKDGGTNLEPVVDFTPFYTSSTTDPAVSDTIYSDAACTTAVTTISSIA